MTWQDLSIKRNKKMHHNHSHDNNEQAPITRGETFRWATFYDLIVKFVTLGKDQALRRKTVDFAQLKPGDHVLDVGCGTGDLALAAKTAVGASGTVYGIDPSPEMIARARRKADLNAMDVQFQTGVIEKLAFPDNEFDVALISFVIHHLPGDDLKAQGLAEVFRILRPGGRFLAIGINFKRQSLATLIHGGTTQSDPLQDKIPAVISEIGFTNIDAGIANKIGRLVSYASGNKPA